MSRSTYICHTSYYVHRCTRTHHTPHTTYCTAVHTYSKHSTTAHTNLLLAFRCRSVWGLLCAVTVYRLPNRLPAKSALTWPVVYLVAYKPSQKLIVRKLNLLNIKMMLRGSLTSDKNKWDRSCWKVPGAHTLLMSEGDEQFHRKTV